jgi:redox-sensing transcriptional repressor
MPRYRRYLKDLHKKGVSKISSNQFSKLIGQTASQIRQDFNHFGGFGQQGYGYNIEELHHEVSMILGLDKKYTMVVVGAGNLGQAIINFTYYNHTGFVVSSIFDTSPKLIGTKVNDVEILDYKELHSYVSENKIDIGIICTSIESAQNVADKLIAAGIKGIWNFAPIDLDISEDVALENVHLNDSLYFLSYHISKKK